MSIEPEEHILLDTVFSQNVFKQYSEEEEFVGKDC
jgi:hypothetical protein